MKSETFRFDLITPCFCSGAEPDQQAEIRVPSIRGQLRWWFRTLGGFQSLAPMSVREQEAVIFGSIADKDGRAGKLMVRVAALARHRLTDSTDHPAPGVASPEGYLLFPLRTQSRKRSALPSFDLHILWRGNPALWADIRALVAVLGHLGSLGFRSRRAMGALAFVGRPPLELREAFPRFHSPSGIVVRQLPAKSATDAITALSSWLRSCRAHGRSGQNDKEKQSGFFNFAEVDHNIGYRMPGTQGKPAFRPALGLPIIQRIRNGTNNWEFGRGTRQEPKGRFASPVLLRPHRDAQGKWHALVIFVDAHKWPIELTAGRPKQVFLNGQPQNVSLDLYEAMKEPGGKLPNGQPGLLKPFP